MPPKRQRRVAAAILDRVLDTANLPHSVDILALKDEIEQQLRVLNARWRAGHLGKGDSTESRKLVLLQHILAASKQEIPVKTLASAVGMRAKDFEALSNKIKHVNVSSTTATSQNKKQKTSSRQSTGSQSRNTANTVVVAAAVRSTIPALSIRLGSQVHDSHGFAQRAQQLYNDMEYHIRSSLEISTPRKQGFLHDMQRSRATYEAACFYLVARGRKMKKKTSRGRGEDGSLQEEDDTQLSIQDIVDASTSVSASDFRDILATVEKFASEMENNQRKMPASGKRPAAGRTKPNRTSATSKQGESKVDGSAQALIEGVEEAAASGTKRQRNGASASTTAPTFVYSPKFLEWKKRVLHDSYDITKQAMSKEQQVEIERISDHVAKQRAADEVLRRSGLLG